MHVNLPYLQEMLLFLGAATILVPLLKRCKVNPILGYLIVGLLIGPYGLSRLLPADSNWALFVVAHPKDIEPLAELGVAFLLFTIGLELSLDRLWSMRRLIFGLGSLQVILTSLVIAVIAYLWGNAAPASVLIGGSLALSSTAVVTKLLVDHHEFVTPVGRTGFSVLLLQDLAVVPLLILVSLFGDTIPNAGLGSSILFSLVESVLVIIAIGVAGRMVLRPIYRYVAQSYNTELFTALTLLVVIGSAALTASVGMSMALGAFLSGLILAETEFRHQIETDIEPIKGLLLGLFFMSVGMGIDVVAVWGLIDWVLLSVIGLILIKTGILAGLGILFKLSKPLAWRNGVMLAQSGEFAFVILGMAAGENLMPDTALQFMLIVSSLSIMATPLLYSLGKLLAARLIEKHESKAVEKDEDYIASLSDHVIIAGFGRSGQILASLLREQNIAFIGIDLNSDLPSEMRKEGFPVIFGDAQRESVLKRLNAYTAKALVVTMNEPRATLNTVSNARKAFPDLKIFVRAVDEIHAIQLRIAGADLVCLETVEMSFQLGNCVLQEFNIPLDVIDQLIDVKRQKQAG